VSFTIRLADDKGLTLRIEAGPMLPVRGQPER